MTGSAPTARRMGTDAGELRCRCVSGIGLGTANGDGWPWGAAHFACVKPEPQSQSPLSSSSEDILFSNVPRHAALELHQSPPVPPLHRVLGCRSVLTRSFVCSATNTYDTQRTALVISGLFQDPLHAVRDSRHSSAWASQAGTCFWLLPHQLCVINDYTMPTSPLPQKSPTPNAQQTLSSHIQRRSVPGPVSESVTRWEHPPQPHSRAADADQKCSAAVAGCRRAPNPPLSARPSGTQPSRG